MYRGVKEMIEAEKNLEKNKFSYQGESFPSISTQSSLARNLTPEIFQKYADV